MTEDNFALKDSGDVIAFSGCFMGVLFLLYAVFRVLSPMTDSSKALRYYKNTLLLYVFGVLCAFGGLIVSAFI